LISIVKRADAASSNSKKVSPFILGRDQPDTIVVAVSASLFDCGTD
jgi:hypothetical protein